jgi:hypothetical protein
LPILGGFVPEIVSPIHVVQSSEPGAVTANAWRKAVRSRLRHDDTKTDLVQEEEIKPRRVRPMAMASRYDLRRLGVGASARIPLAYRPRPVVWLSE